MEEHFTLLRFSINEVFNAIKDQQWVKRSKPIQYDSTLLGAEEYCKGHQTIHCKSFRKYLEELSAKTSSKSTSLPPITSDARQPSAPPPTNLNT